MRMLEPLMNLNMKPRPLLCFWVLTLSASTFAAGNGPSVFVAVEEKSDAILPCSLSTKQNIEKKVFDWKKDGQKEVFLYVDGSYYGNGRTGQDEQFKGRVSHFKDELKNGNASIKITKAQMADNGSYTCTFPDQQTFHITLFVGAAPKPYVTSIKQTSAWSLLQCEVRGASPKPTVQWRDSSGNILPATEPQFTERGGYDVILQITVNKTGTYRCVATQEDINHEIGSEIDVYIAGAAPKPYVTSIKQTSAWSLLQCEVRGASPKPTVQWRDSSGNILPATEPQFTERGGYDVILQITVNKTGTYRCVATQEDINHEIGSEIDVYIAVSEINTVLMIGLIFCGVVVGVVLGVGAVCLWLRRRPDNTKTDGKSEAEALSPPKQAV